MLFSYLARFNKALTLFQAQYPLEEWSADFKNNLINDFTFYSARVENDSLQYGDTIRFLNGQLVRKEKMISLLDVGNHKDVLSSFLNRYDRFELTEESIKEIHYDLMSCESAWDVNFRSELVGNYRNIPTVGSREPLDRDKEYAPHYNLEFIMPTHVEQFNWRLKKIDNSTNETHLVTTLCYIHNRFLNEIHPFADGNGRVCRILMGTIMMKNNCPPIFKKITSDEDRVEYITTVITCEKVGSDEPLVEYLANGLSEYLEEKLS